MERDVTVITAAYNAAETIGQCIDSVSRQRRLHEHIIVDGQSTDETLEVIDARGHERLRVISERDAGLYDALNKGIELATGRITAILNADDFYETIDVLGIVGDAIANDIQAVYGDLVYVDRANSEAINRYWRGGKYARSRFWYGWMPPHPAFFLATELYRKYGVFRLDQGSAADYELMLRMLVKHSVEAVYIPHLMVRMRSGGMSNASFLNRLRANRMDRLAWVRNGLRPYPWTTMLKPVRKLAQFILRPRNLSSASIVNKD